MARASAADAAETARRILETAASHFAAQGYGAASVDEIARASAVTRGAVYHHYTSKPLLFAAVAAEQQRIVADAIVTATAESTPDTALRDGSHAFLDAITRGAASRVLLIDGPAVLGCAHARRGVDVGRRACGRRDVSVRRSRLRRADLRLCGL